MKTVVLVGVMVELLPVPISSSIMTCQTTIFLIFCFDATAKTKIDQRENTKEKKSLNCLANFHGQ